MKHQTVRDEVHRFTVTFHRTRRNTSRLNTELARIPGIGEKTSMKLLREFGFLERVRQASKTTSPHTSAAPREKTQGRRLGGSSPSKRFNRS